MASRKHGILGFVAASGVAILAFSYCGGDPEDEGTTTTTSSQEPLGNGREALPPSPEGTRSPATYATPAQDAAQVRPHAVFAPAQPPFVPQPPCTSCPQKVEPPGAHAQ